MVRRHTTYVKYLMYLEYVTLSLSATSVIATDWLANHVHNKHVRSYSVHRPPSRKRNGQRCGRELGARRSAITARGPQRTSLSLVRQMTLVPRVGEGAAIRTADLARMVQGSTRDASYPRC
jgi:hypothetical protein